MTETFSPMLPNEIEDATQELLERACELDLRLATAESCTGGLLGSLLTDVQGASHAFERGFIVYTNEAKHELLGVPMTVLDEKGAVSREAAIAMAEGALARSRADIALSVTGFAGPGGEEDESGLVHFACARKGCETRHREEHFGDIGRGPTRVECVRTSLEMMREMIG